MFTGKDFKVGLLVAVVSEATHRVNAGVLLDRRGADEGSVSRDQFLIVYTLALLYDQLAS